MAPVFIFAKDIEKILKEGKKEIGIPTGARISAAAHDLIRDNRIQINYGSGPVAEVRKGTLSQDVTPGKRTGPAGKPGEDLSNLSPKSAGFVLESGVEISEEDLVEIVNRVARQFRRIKGQRSPETTHEDATADDDDLVICRCEEITKGEIKEAVRNGIKTLNGIKRTTRAGMGLCQGQTCQQLIIQILAGELGVNPADLEPITARAPARPIPLSVFASG